MVVSQGCSVTDLSFFWALVMLVASIILMKSNSKSPLIDLPRESRISMAIRAIGGTLAMLLLN